MKPTVYLPFLGLVALTACNNLYSPSTTPPPPPPNFTTFRAEGDVITVTNNLDAFRAALGGVLNAPNTPPAASGRREINWDGVPAAVTNVDNFPATFFNVNSKRGALLSTPGTGLRVDSTAFASVTAGLADQFKAFSPQKLFMAVGSNQVEVDFKLAGETTNGLTKGFGVVFSDVDRAGSTRIEYFDANGVRIASIEATAQSGAQGFSFLGAVFDSPIVARVLITSGDAALSATGTDLSAGGSNDLVVMDDFVYGEPQPLPGQGGGAVGQVTVGNVFFRSAHNGSQNPAVDTIAAGGSITWAWNAAGSHSIQSIGVPDIFRNSVVMAGANDTYTVTFRNPGTYSYQCAVHGSAMTGRIVVQ